MTALGNATTTGLAGFTSYSIGTLGGPGLSAGSSANGTLISTGTGSAGPTGFVGVGTITSTTAAGTATGVMSIGGALNLNAGGLFVANVFDAARGSVANGTVSIGGDAGTASLVLIGSVFPINPPAQVGNTAIGSVTIGNGGGIQWVPARFVGIGTANSPRVGAFVDQAQGTLAIDGALTFNGNASMSIGVSDGGIANGALTVGSLVMGANSVGLGGIGNTFGGGTAIGRLTAGSGDLRVQGGLDVGNAFSPGATGANAEGLLALGGQLLCTGCGGFGDWYGRWQRNRDRPRQRDNDGSRRLHQLFDRYARRPRIERRIVRRMAR